MTLPPLLSELRTNNTLASDDLYSLGVDGYDAICSFQEVNETLFLNTLSLIFFGLRKRLGPDFIHKLAFFSNTLSHIQPFIHKALASVSDFFLLPPFESHFLFQLDDYSDFSSIDLSFIEVCLFFHIGSSWDEFSKHIPLLVTQLPTSNLGRHTILFTPNCTTVPPPFDLLLRPLHIQLYPPIAPRIIVMTVISGLSTMVSSLIGETGAVLVGVLVAQNRSSNINSIISALEHRGFPTTTVTSSLSDVLLDGRIVLWDEDSVDVNIIKFPYFDIGVVVGQVDNSVLIPFLSGVRSNGKVVMLPKQAEVGIVSNQLSQIALPFRHYVPSLNISLDSDLLISDFVLNLSRLSVNFKDASVLIKKWKKVRQHGLTGLVSEVLDIKMMDELLVKLEVDDECTCNLPDVDCWVVPIKKV
ncbi:hypothetical protein RCL1_008828 [Eukaryota sp. TZLM3-RCL]